MTVKTLQLQERHKELRFCVTSRCNLFCKGCHGEGIMKGGKPVQDKLKPEDYGFVFRSAKKLGINSVCISGGEPMIKPETTDIVRILSMDGAEINIITNGVHSLRNREVFDYVREVHLSLHSAAEQYEKFRKVYKKKEYDKLTLQTLEFLAAKGILVKLNVVATQNNTTNEDIMWFVEFARQFGAIPRYIELYPKSSDGFKSRSDLEVQLTDLGWARIGSELRKVRLESSEFGLIELLKCGCAIARAIPLPDIACKSVNQVYLFSDGSFNYCRENNEDAIESFETIRRRDELHLIEQIKLAIELVGSPCNKRRE